MAGVRERVVQVWGWVRGVRTGELREAREGERRPFPSKCSSSVAKYQPAGARSRVFLPSWRKVRVDGGVRSLAGTAEVLSRTYSKNGIKKKKKTRISFNLQHMSDSGALENSVNQYPDF